MVLLFVDMLGVRAQWLKGGRQAAEEAFIKFRNLIAYSIKDTPKENLIHGIIETDAVAFTCSDIFVALKIAKKMYRSAFEQTIDNEENRIWLRGVIVPRKTETSLRYSTNFRNPLEQVELMLYDSDLLDAIALEKSGIKGMRLVVDKSLITEDVNTSLIQKIEIYNFIPFKKLKNSSYPGNLGESYCDYLWMSSESEDELERYERIMALRLRKSSQSSEEFLQAAATQVVFHECTAMIGSLRTRYFWRNIKNNRSKD